MCSLVTKRGRPVVLTPAGPFLVSTATPSSSFQATSTDRADGLSVVPTVRTRKSRDVQAV